MFFLHRIWNWCSRFRHRCGYGVHSPSDFFLITSVVYEKYHYYAYRVLKERGFPAYLPHYRRKVNRLLFRLVNYFRPKSLIEVGIGNGASIGYMRAACHTMDSVTLKGRDWTKTSRQLEEKLSEVHTLDCLHIGQYGVDVSKIVRGGDQIGIYFLEKKTSQRPSNVIYNRSGSAIALAEESDFDWDAIFEDATWFHFSGITPAISDTLAKVCLTACKKAKEKGMTVSCDLNYRSKLWSGEKANKVMTEICQYVDICIANEDDAIGIFQLEPVGEGTEKNEYIAKELMKRFPFKMVAAVWRTETSITTFKLQSMIYTDGKAYYSKEYFMHILDYIGAGDAFCAGLIYACLQKYDAQKMVEFANAASCLKHTVSGDFNLVTADEVSQLAFSESGNEVQR